MKLMKALSLVMALLLMVDGLCSCGTSGQGYSSRTVQITTPLKAPIYGEAIIGNYDSVDPLHKRGDFIFKGRIDKIEEVDVSWQAVTSIKTIETAHQWLSSCEVTIENVLYGEVPGVKDKIKVAFISSSRMSVRDVFELKEGQEYYFLTRIFTKEERTQNGDPVKMYQFGDVQGSNIFSLMPVYNGIVSFREGWPFEGAKHPVVTNDNFDTLEGTTATIDEESFLQQFTAMIQAAKGSPAPETTAPD